ncbi:MAG TPA: ABC transporter permease, partial [Candidatus Acidoferrales bacterium]|nr:ABC transporter permease [Candidatus Acidoferrales bacterium]
SDLDEELKFHVEQKMLDLIARGMDPLTARTAALRSFGGVEKMKEECHDMRGTRSIEDFWQDFRFGARTFGKDRRFTLLAVIALALGVGASTVVFSVVYDGLLNPFPYKNPRGITIFQIHDSSQSGVRGRGAFTFQEFLDFREQNHVFSDMVGTAYTNVLYSTGSSTQALRGAFVTTNTFSFLGVPPILGRPMADDDAKPGAAPVFDMSYQCWKEQFAGDPAILGKQFILNGVSRTLVGIMQPRFKYFGVDVYFPLGLARDTPAAVNEYGQPRYLVGEERLKPGVTYADVAADMNAVAHRRAESNPHDYPKSFTIHVDSLASDVVGNSKAMLYMLLAAVAMLLLIACSNVANLLLARATVREKEIALRASLGAGRSRLIRQLLVESLVLGLGGGAAGCLLAYAGIRATAALIPGILPGEAVIELNWPVLIFAVGVTIIVTVICGLAPALHSVRRDLNSRLVGAAKGSGSNARHGKLRSALVIAEVALSIILLAGACLMLRTLYALAHVDLGFNPQNVLAMEISFPQGRYTTVPEKRQFFDQVLAKVEAVPGVTSAAETISLPPYNSAGSALTVAGKVHSDSWRTLFDVCSEDYFKTLGVHLLRGRFLSAEDVAAGRFVAVVNQTFARRYLAPDDPLGQKIKFDILDRIEQTPHNAYFEVVGIVSDVRNSGLEREADPEAYIPYTISAYENRAMLIRAAVDPTSILKTIQQQVWSVDRSVAISEANTLTHYIQQYSYSEPEFGLESLGAFAAIGLALAAIGVFSVMGYAVSLQTHEFGIRMALGAQRANIFKMVFSRGLAIVGIGIVIGLSASIASLRLISSEIYGVKASDPLTFAITAIVVLLVGAVACYLPARRATRVDPLVALRYE